MNTTRRVFLFGMTALVPGLSMLAIGKAWSNGAEPPAPTWTIRSHIPGGVVELQAAGAEYESSKAILEVRRDSESATAVCESQIHEERCSLTLDLPSKNWQPGQYEARIRLMGTTGSLVWESSWQHAFSLRPLPWLG